MVSDFLGLIGPVESFSMVRSIVGEVPSGKEPLRLILDAIRQPMLEWAAHYGWPECWRWFPCDLVPPPNPMDVPRPIADHLLAVEGYAGRNAPLQASTSYGVRRDVSGCVDYKTEEDAMRALALACVLWLQKQADDRRDWDDHESESIGRMR